MKDLATRARFTNWNQEVDRIRLGETMAALNGYRIIPATKSRIQALYPGGANLQG